MSLSKFQQWHIKQAVSVLRSGGVVAHPTEAVWGLACDPGDQRAVYKILDLKKRDVKKGLILVSGDPSHFSSFFQYLPESLQERFYTKAERPTTWLVPDDTELVPAYVKGAFSSVALRLSAHPLVVALSKGLGGPIVSTSANPAGKAPAVNLREARSYFGPGVDYLLDGRLGGFNTPSEIRDLVTGQVLRS